MDDLQAIDIQGSTASLDLHPTSSTSSTINSTITNPTTTSALLGEKDPKRVADDKRGLKEAIPGSSRGGHSSKEEMSMSMSNVLMMNDLPIQKAPSSPIPPLDLGQPYIRGKHE